MDDLTMFPTPRKHRIAWLEDARAKGYHSGSCRGLTADELSRACGDAYKLFLDRRRREAQQGAVTAAEVNEFLASLP